MRSFFRFAPLAIACCAFSVSAHSQSSAWQKLNPVSYFHHTAAPVPSGPDAPGPGSSLMHTRAHFMLNGQDLGAVQGGYAVLYDASDPGTRETVAALESGREGVPQASRVCQALVPGAGSTVSPDGDIYFDYVGRASYSILLCAQVKFQGVTKPVWVASSVQVAPDSFTMARTHRYELPDTLNIDLAPYAAELHAEPLPLQQNAAPQLPQLAYAAH